MTLFRDLDKLAELPLWAQVLLASRMARRAALWLPPQAPQHVRSAIVAGCDALDRVCEHAGGFEDVMAIVERASDINPGGMSGAAAESFVYAADACHAAFDSGDFSAAETACSNSTRTAISHAGNSAGLNPIQVMILAAADADQLGFACKEARIGRYDALSRDVMQRLAPVYPPDRPTVAPHPMADDPTGGAR